MCSMGADDDDRKILDHLLDRHPAMVTLDEVLALQGVEHARKQSSACALTGWCRSSAD
jgi:hypothetical protein